MNFVRGKIFKLVIVLVVCFSLWMSWQVSSLPYWFDEVNSIYYATQEDSARMIEMVENDFSPPLYYYVLRGWVKLVGVSEAATASLSFVFVLVSIIVIYWVSKKMFSKQVALYTSLIFVCSPLFLVYGTETRMYSLVVLLAFMSMGCVWLAIDKNKIIYWLGLICFSVLGAYTHYAFWFIIAAQNIFLIIYFFWKRDKARRVVVPWVVAQVVTVVVFGRWWLVLLERVVDTNSASFSYWPQIIQGGSVLGPVSFLLTSFSLSEYYVVSFLIELFLLGVVLMVFFKFNRKERTIGIRRIGPAEIFVLVLVCVPIFINNMLGVFVVRYMIFSLVLFYLLLATGLSRIKNKQVAQLMLLLILVASLLFNATITNQQKIEGESRWVTVGVVDYLNQQTECEKLVGDVESEKDYDVKMGHTCVINNNNQQDCWLEEKTNCLKPEDQIILINPAHLKALVDYYYQGNVQVLGGFPDSEIINEDLGISVIRRICMPVVTRENVDEIIDQVKHHKQVYLVQYSDKVLADRENLIEMRLDQECELLDVWSPGQTALIMPYVVKYACGTNQ